MADKELDPVEWELVRADIAMEKARLKANGDWAKWEKFQAQANAARWMARGARWGLPVADEERVTLFRFWPLR
jgi:hypothetical protein